MSVPRPAYVASPIKRHRATDAEMMQRRADLARIVQLIQPCSVRQAFYQAEIRGVVEKTESGYEKVQRDIVWLRQKRIVPFTWISDGTRWMRKPASHDSIEDALRETAETYRRAVWRDEDVYVEFWIEKDALAGTIYDVTEQFDVPLMVARGYSSITFLHSAASAIEAGNKIAFVYQLGDYDPSGQDAADHIERKLREYAPRAVIHYQRLAVTPEQIARWKLPTRPTKKTDSRSKEWEGDSVELDAIPPDSLRSLVREAIEHHISPARLRVIEAAEQSEREGALIFLTVREEAKRRGMVDGKGGAS
jgi:hypothetical protein